MTIEDCISAIRQSSSCVLRRPCGLPRLPEGLSLPEDVRHFYEAAGGAVLFKGAPYEFEIVSPDEFVRANPVIVLQPHEHDVSYNWFIIVQSSPQYISIDLNPSRVGRCYDSFWDRHALRGTCPVIARSFTELLERLLSAKGEELFWLSTEFVSLGDAYDDVP
jgi:hypothetical protein